LGARTELLADGLDIFVSQPLFGAGLGGAGAALGEIPHMTLIWVLADMGLAGFLVYTVVLLLPSIRAIFLRNQDAVGTATAAALMAMFVGSLSIEASFQRLWWAILGVWLFTYSVREGPDPARRKAHFVPQYPESYANNLREPTADRGLPS
jgi:O-antigen ligase